MRTTIIHRWALLNTAIPSRIEVGEEIGSDEFDAPAILDARQRILDLLSTGADPDLEEIEAVCSGIEWDWVDWALGDLGEDRKLTDDLQERHDRNQEEMDHWFDVGKAMAKGEL